MKLIETVATIKEVEQPIGGTSQNGKEWKKVGIVFDVSDTNPSTGQRYEEELYAYIYGTEQVDGFLRGGFAAGQTVSLMLRLSSRQYTRKDGAQAWSTDVRIANIRPYASVAPQTAYYPQQQPMMQQRAPQGYQQPYYPQAAPMAQPSANPLAQYTQQAVPQQPMMQQAQPQMPQPQMPPAAPTQPELPF